MNCSATDSCLKQHTAQLHLNILKITHLLKIRSKVQFIKISKGVAVATLATPLDPPLLFCISIKTCQIFLQFEIKEMSFDLLNKNFKIPKLSSNSNSMQLLNKYREVVINQDDMLRIFKNLTIAFIGDSSISTIYRDFVKFFSKNRLLENTEAAIQHGEYKEADGEIRLEKGGQRGSVKYKDIREYYCSISSTRLIYIYISTSYGSIPIENINYLERICPSKPIHAIIFSSYHVELNFAKLSKSQSSFENILENYKDNLHNLCHRLIEIS